jgi:hypothetical protein
MCITGFCRFIFLLPLSIASFCSFSLFSFSVNADAAGVVLADTAENNPEADLSVAKSEHFRVGQIVFGGESDFLLDASDPTPLKIDGVRGEIASQKGKKETQLVIVWKTNRPTSGEVTYGKNRGVN